MDKEKDQIIQEAYERLPEDVKKALTSADLRPAVDSIARKYKLMIDQGTSLENEIIYTMLGLEHPDEFVQNLAKNIEVDKEKATLIARDVNDMIFLKIRESLMKLHENEENGEVEIADTEEVLDKTQILNEIENPKTNASIIPQAQKVQNPKIESVPVNMIEDKMSGIVRLPKQEITLVNPPEKAEKTLPKTARTVDPYKESIE